MGKKSYTAGPPPKEAIDYFDSKGWKVGFDHRDVWAQEHAFAFTAAKAMTADVLEGIRGALDSALQEGKTFAQFKKELTPELQRLGWWGRQEVLDPKDGEKKISQLGSPRRLKVIYQTNMRMARSAGKWDRIERTKKLLPFLKYSLGPAEKHRPEHVAWEGTILPADDSWWDTHMPPNGWNCKCWVQQLTRTAVDKAGGPSDRPNDGEREHENPRTGERMMVPNGVTPGFNYNAGKVRQEKNLEQFKDKLNGVSATAADAVQRAWMQPAFFAAWREEPKGDVPVAAMDPDTQQVMGAQQKTITLSAQTMLKQQGKTSRSKGNLDLSDDDYCLIPDVVAKGQIIRKNKQKTLYFHHHGKLYTAVVKTTKDGRENYLDSFRFAKESDIRRELRFKGAEEIRPEVLEE